MLPRAQEQSVALAGIAFEVVLHTSCSQNQEILVGIKKPDFLAFVDELLNGIN